MRLASGTRSTVAALGCPLGATPLPYGCGVVDDLARCEVAIVHVVIPHYLADVLDYRPYKCKQRT